MSSGVIETGAILCCGESLIDLVPQPDGALRPLPGGAVFNTAVALGRLGTRTAYLWPVSRDGFGPLLLARLAEAGVDTAGCPRTARPTTLAVVSLTRGDARYTFHDDGSAGRLFAETDLPPLPANLRALFVGGISLTGEPCGATVETLVGRAAAAGVPVMLDPNVRPFAIGRGNAYRARIDRLIGLASIVKLSADDLAWLWPGASPDEAARSLLARGPRLVLTTAGADGAAAHTAAHRVASPARRVAVADSIGAGDSFDAGILDGLARAGMLGRLDALTPDTLAAVLAHAAAVAAVTVSRPGADPPWRHELP